MLKSLQRVQTNQSTHSGKNFNLRRLRLSFKMLSSFSGHPPLQASRLVTSLSASEHIPPIPVSLPGLSQGLPLPTGPFFYFHTPLCNSHPCAPPGSPLPPGTMSGAPFENAPAAILLKH